MLQSVPPPPVEIVVTGRSLEASRGERLLRPTIIGPAELADTPLTGLDQLLTAEAGLQLFRRSDARSANPTTQGITLRALGGNAGSRTLLILDGVPQTDPFGGWAPWPAFDPAGLAEVRITRGGGGVTAGPGALAGVIELTSRSDERLRADIEGGSRGSLQGSLGASAQVGSGRVTFSASGARGDGFSPIVAADRGPADRAAPYRNAAGVISPPSGAPSYRPACPALPTAGTEASIIARTCHAEPTPRCDWWVAVHCPSCCWATPSGAASRMARHRSPPAAPKPAPPRCSMRCLPTLSAAAPSFGPTSCPAWSFASVRTCA
jgi:hypothetical protein